MGVRECRGPPVKILPPPMWPLMKFIIKHNLTLVRGGSLWQYRSVPPPAAIMATPLPPPPNVNPRTATVTMSILYDTQLFNLRSNLELELKQ